MSAFIEQQREQIATLEGQLREQRDTWEAFIEAVRSVMGPSHA